jgi:hypothetical protein
LEGKTGAYLTAEPGLFGLSEPLWTVITLFALLAVLTVLMIWEGASLAGAALAHSRAGARRF